MQRATEGNRDSALSSNRDCGRAAGNSRWIAPALSLYFRDRVVKYIPRAGNWLPDRSCIEPILPRPRGPTTCLRQGKPQEESLPLLIGRSCAPSASITCRLLQLEHKKTH